MEWKKINVDPVEFESRTRFYSQQAVSMMKKSVNEPHAETAGADTAAGGNTGEYPAVTAEAPAAPQKKDAGPDAGEETAAEESREQNSEAPEGEVSPADAAGSEAEQQIGESCDIADKPGIQKEFGVFTPEEILAAKEPSEGMKEAARILGELGGRNGSQGRQGGSSFQKQSPRAENGT